MEVENLFKTTFYIRKSSKKVFSGCILWLYNMNKILICGITVSVIILIIGVTYLPSIIDRTTYLEEVRKETALVKEIIDDRDCWRVKDLLKSGEIDDEILKIIVSGFNSHCNSKWAEINDKGIDISNAYTRNYDYILK